MNSGGTQPNITAVRTRVRRAVSVSDQAEAREIRREDYIGTKRKKKLTLEAYKAHKTNVGRACEAVGIHRRTFSRWCNEDEEFNEMVGEIEQAYLDDLISLHDRIAIEDRNPKALQWKIERKSKDRAYSVERTRHRAIEHSGPQGGPIQTSGEMKITDLRGAIPPSAVKTALRDLLKKNPDLIGKAIQAAEEREDIEISNVPREPEREEGDDEE